MTAAETTARDRFNSVDEMRDSVLFDGPERSRRISRFWLLLILASVIASAGVVGDSTATVIGAMIVAPLMTPILGTMLATVIGDRRNLIRSLGFVIAGALAAVAIGYVVGLIVPVEVLASTNSQVAARVSPRLIDLLAALATGVVGSVALVRRDISDTLPGVAIAISLVPPLTVAGLALESGSPAQSVGAVLLFTTNVVAILCTGIIVMSIYGVTRLAAEPTADRKKASLRRPIILLSVMAVIVAIPLAITSITIATTTITDQRIRDISASWAEPHGWAVTDVVRTGTEIHIEVEGPLPDPDTDDLVAALTAAGVDITPIIVDLTPVTTVRLSDE
ncbi:DUF389 domain-containing protein [Herbiconiux moechotypicola]|uniref:DUF389 domain-containing protein n=1 Tax=Herbiconiux moechotypicola TaxID=637393 RepID=A0ABP5QY68_9MICO|nr:DUF389 domain-containing protein [Herbiconiux moechotypicola]MCS5731237.1 DUF389 domain-containing protein [Herbiconiux moechotypicola]